MSYDRKGNLFGSTETVTITYFGGHTDRINVTGNSLLAILHEVVREIDGHHAHGHIYGRVRAMTAAQKIERIRELIRQCEVERGRIPEARK